MTNFRTAYNYTPDPLEGESFNLKKEPSLTLPNRHKTVQQIFQNTLEVNGLKLKQYGDFDADDEIDLDNFPLERIEDFDISDAQIFIEKTSSDILRLQQLQEEAKKKLDSATEGNPPVEP